MPASKSVTGSKAESFSASGPLTRTGGEQRDADLPRPRDFHVGGPSFGLGATLEF